MVRDILRCFPVTKPTVWKHYPHWTMLEIWDHRFRVKASIARLWCIESV